MVEEEGIKEDSIIKLIFIGWADVPLNFMEVSLTITCSCCCCFDC